MGTVVQLKVTVAPLITKEPDSGEIEDEQPGTTGGCGGCCTDSLRQETAQSSNIRKMNASRCKDFIFLNNRILKYDKMTVIHFLDKV